MEVVSKQASSVLSYFSIVAVSTSGTYTRSILLRQYYWYKYFYKGFLHQYRSYTINNLYNVAYIDNKIDRVWGPISVWKSLLQIKQQMGMLKQFFHQNITECLLNCRKEIARTLPWMALPYPIFSLYVYNSFMSALLYVIQCHIQSCMMPLWNTDQGSV